MGKHFVRSGYSAERSLPVTVVEDKTRIRHMRILIQMLDTPRVDRRRTLFQAVNDITFAQQESGQIGSVLACHTGH